MNLLDRRGNASENEREKFDFCKRNSIVGIGWVGYEDADREFDPEDQKAFLNAKSKLEKFGVGDLVWVKVPEMNEYYLCEITASMQKAETNIYHLHDIGYYCKCEYLTCFKSKKLPYGLTAEELICHSAISGVKIETESKTLKCYKSLPDLTNSKNLFFESEKAVNSKEKTINAFETDKLKRVGPFLILILVVFSLVMLILAPSFVGHTHVMDERTLVNATCTVTGVVECYCRDCDYTYTKNIEPSHNYIKKELVPSTCLEKGKAEFTCNICNDSYVEELSLSSHSYVDKSKYCSVCGERKIGTIDTPYTPISLDYGSGKYVLSTCKIKDVSVEINTYGQMTVYFEGIKTFDYSGDSHYGPCAFTMIIRDNSGSIIYSDQIMTSGVVNQEFKVYTNPTGYYDSSEDYRIELKDCMF